MGEKEKETNTEGKDEGKEKAKDDSGTGTEEKTDETKTDETKTVSTLDRADQIAQMQKRENDRREGLITREEQLEARKAVGGVTEAGQGEKKKVEETAKEYKDRVMRGEA